MYERPSILTQPAKSESRLPQLIVAVALVAIGFASGVFFQRGRTQPAPAVPSEKALQAQFSEALQTQMAGRPAQAATLYVKLLSDSQEWTQKSNFNLGVVFQGQKRWQEARQAYEKALCLDPASAGATYNLGFVMLEMNEPETALRYFVRAQQLQPANSSAIFYAGQIAAKFGRKSEAESYFRKALEISPGLAPAKQALLNLAR